ncbi:hypothetical protein HZC30_00105 [Candidatus Woesearchaeota archaeon]|nr:hypothetical protein [Candidatus Woesearchaeota archaeon]
MECKSEYRKKCNFFKDYWTVIGVGSGLDRCLGPNARHCQLYQAWEENARLKKQSADGSLEERVRKDLQILGQMC